MNLFDDLADPLGPPEGDAIVRVLVVVVSGWLLCAGVSASAASAAKCSGPPPPKTVAYERIRGVAPDLTSLDVYAPPRRCPPSSTLTAPTG